MTPQPQTGARSFLLAWLPILAWGRATTGRTLRADAIAGATAAAVVIPQAMAYATVAGLPVQTGLYCALVPAAVYAVLGTSRALSLSTTSTISLLTAQAVADAGAGDDAGKALTLAGTLALLTGLMLVVAGVIRLGFLADFIGPQVLAGFKVGVGLVILVDQLSRVLGITVEGDNFFEKVASAVGNLSQTEPTTAVLAGLSVATLLVLRRFLPRLPGPLIVLAAGILVVALLDLSGDGVALISPIPSGLPAPGWPGFDSSLALLPAAAGIALMCFVESIAAARSFKRADDTPIDADQELRALGACNAVGAVFGAYPVGGGLSQTAVNDQSGARSQAAGLVTVLGVGLTLTLIAPVFDNLAQATLGAIVLVAALGLIDREPLRELRHLQRIQWWMALVPLVGVLLFGTVDGVLLGVLASMVSLFYFLSHAPVSVIDRTGLAQTEGVSPDARPPGSAASPPAGLLMVRVETVLYFANVRPQLERVARLASESDDQPDVLVLDLLGQGDTGKALADGLHDLCQRLEREGITLWLSGVRPHVEVMLTRTSIWHAEPIPLYANAADAVAAYESRP